MSKQRSAEGIYRSALSLKIRVFRGLFGQFFHSRYEPDARTAGRALGACHFDSRIRGGAAAILFRAVITCALLARNMHFFGHGFVAWDFFLDDLNHAAFSTRVNFFSNGVEMAGFHLLGFRTVTSSEAATSEHGTTRGKTKGDCDQWEKLKEFFHEIDEVGFRLK
jgi:hypothetical protein